MVIAKCQWWKNHRAKPSRPLMGPIPAERLKPYVRPFKFNDVDLAGPVNMTIGRRPEKRWFTNCRGVPSRMRSDQGTNFIGAAKVLDNATVPIE